MTSTKATNFGMFDAYNQYKRFFVDLRISKNQKYERRDAGLHTIFMKDRYLAETQVYRLKLRKKRKTEE